MKYPFIKPLMLIGALFVLVTLACSTPSPAPTEAPVQAPAEPVQTKAVEPAQPAQPAEPAQPAQAVASGAVSSLTDVRNAAIQIQAEGTFVDFDGAYVGAGRGSGFIIDSSGLAVTNNHVVTGAALLKVWIGGDTTKSYNARVVAVSECSDLAVIDIDGDGFPYLEWYSDPIAVGLEVYSVGFPLGETEYTLTKGIVSKESTSGESDWASVDSVIMHDATINPGNSGGPLVTADGKIVGVNYAAAADVNQYFAIGREKALPIIDELKAGRDVDSLGINGQAIVSDDGTISGIWVSSVASGSPADRAGIIGGDILMGLQGHPVGANAVMADYCDIIRTHNASDVMDIEVYRYDTDETLAGQLNGSALAVTSTGSSGTSSSTSSGSTSSGNTSTVSGDFMAVVDNLDVLYVEIPSWWSEIDGRMWEATWGTSSGDIPFQAASIVAAPSLDDFYSYWSAPGVNFSASTDWGKIGGYVQILDDAGYTWYVDACEKTGRYEYEDPKYEGRFDVWDCGIDADVIVLGARPIADKFAYLVLLQIQLGEDWGDSDGTIEGRISDTFDVVNTLP